ncbi:hypothetical protein PMAYCL1PPCAC_25033, partial [Pristionchus mayeri]
SFIDQKMKLAVLISALVASCLCWCKYACEAVDLECIKLLSSCGIDSNLPTYGIEHLPAIQSFIDSEALRIAVFEYALKRRNRLIWSGV